MVCVSFVSLASTMPQSAEKYPTLENSSIAHLDGC